MLEPVDHQYLMVGRIVRSHGTDGTVLMIPEYDAPALFDDIDLVRLQNTRGDLVPARIESVRVQEKNNRLSFFLKFDHITDRNEAETVKNFPVYVDRDELEPEPEEAFQAALTSFEVMDENGLQVGVVEEVIGAPAQLILTVQTGEGRLLIPFVDEYITEVDEEHKVIYCQNMDQLSDL